ncbi:MAG: ATP synthase F1 subunit delta [Acidobacteria bacterium]|nr:ATP synthase F1 subunit delta [Acidobacteriota bacterium]
MSLAVASRYARALADLVSDGKAGASADEILSQLRAFHGLQSGSVELRNILASPAVPVRKKRAAAGRLAGQLGFGPVLKNFLNVVIDHRRAALMGEILASLEQQLDERRGIVRAAVTSARPLDEAQRSEVEATLARTTGKKVFGQYSVDEALIGGIVARVGSRVYDGSVRGQLQAMRGRLVRS